MVVGGVIPAPDYDDLFQHGAAAIFGPGTVITESTKRTLEILLERL